MSAYQPLVLGERNVCFLSWWWQTKLPPNEFTRLILKARGPRREALKLGVPVPRSYGSTLAIRHSNPCSWSTDHGPSKTNQRQLCTGNTDNGWRCVLYCPL